MEGETHLDGQILRARTWKRRQLEEEEVEKVVERMVGPSDTCRRGDDGMG